MADDVDRCTVLSDTYPVARKAHRCDECGREIRPGESYERECLLSDGSKSTHKTCEHCQVVRDWLCGECGGWVYTMVAEDFHEHASEYRRFDLLRLYAGMRGNWRRRDGSLRPVPKCPPTTLELAKEGP